MRDFRDAKAMARALREHLKSEKDLKLSVAESLELVAGLFGLSNWNLLAARIAGSEEDSIRLNEAIPVIRMFDLAKAIEFYCDFLGFTEDWRGEIFPGAPLYMQLSRGAVKLHLSEHHGDAAPGGTTVISTTGIAALHAELIGKDYRYNRPGLEKAPYGAMVMTAVDPFGNRLRFEEEIAGVGAAVNFEVARSLGAELPDAKATTGKLGMSIRFKGEILACEAIHDSAEPDSLMVRLGFDQRDVLLAQDVQTFYLTGHYQPYPVVLVRLSRISRTRLQTLLREAWEFIRSETG